DLGHVLVGVVPFGAAEERPEVALGHKKEVLAVAAEGRPVGIVPAVGDGVANLLFNRIEVDLRHALVGRRGLGNPLAVRRPVEIADFTHLRLGDDFDRLGGHVHVLEPELLVVPQDLLAVGRPGEGIFVGVGAAGELLPGAGTVGRNDVDFIFAGLVGDEGNVLAVGRPLGIAFVDAGGVGQVAVDAAFGRDGEDAAGGLERGTLAVRGNLIGVDAFAQVLHAGAGRGLVFEDADLPFLNLFGVQVEAVDPAAVFKDNRLVAERRELDV